MKIFLLFGDQLFPSIYFENLKTNRFLMIEAKNICQHFNYHQTRLVFLTSALRHKKMQLLEEGFKVDHVPLEQDFELSYIEKLARYCRDNSVSEIHCFEKEDKFFRKAITDFCLQEKIRLTTYQSPLFINTHLDFKEYLSRHKKPFMKTFYEESRIKYNILIDKNKKPVGGKWSFDDENRSKLKKGVIVPPVMKHQLDPITKEVIVLIEKYFPHAPGNRLSKQPENFIFPVTRADALLHLDHFLKNKLQDFGEFEDAISSQEKFVFHSLLSPVINIGLITPKEVIEHTLAFAKAHNSPLNSVEGFIRQILGWREFVRGVYNEFSEVYEERNYFNHKRKLKKCFYEGNTGILPLDNVIKKVNQHAYAHHIERLMILSNLMLLLEVHPKIVHQYFNEMFVDSMDWVMGPNVYCMGQFSDGGIFATKPYICGSNYILKMSDYKKDEDWCHDVDALYWSFIYNKREFFSSQPRLSMMTSLLNKMDPKKLQDYLERAEIVKNRMTTLASPEGASRLFVSQLHNQKSPGTF